MPKEEAGARVATDRGRFTCMKNLTEAQWRALCPLRFSQGTCAREGNAARASAKAAFVAKLCSPVADYGTRYDLLQHHRSVDDGRERGGLEDELGGRRR